MSEPIAPRQEGDTLVISLVAEKLVKQLHLIEEIRITKQRRTERHRSTMALRDEEVIVDRSPPAASQDPARIKDAPPGLEGDGNGQDNRRNV